MPSLRFEGRDVPFEPGDSLAVALHRVGVRVFSRSFKFHRPRGLYCLSGDCPNCLLNVDGLPGVRSCMTPARSCEVRREGGFPSIGFDVLAILNRLHALMPVGFYYKTFIHPRWAWPVAQRVVERVTGIGALPLDRLPSPGLVEHRAPDVVVIGAGAAGLEAALTAAGAGSSVLVCEERTVGEGVFDVAMRADIERLFDRVVSLGVEVLQRATALGIYDGPLVPISTERGLVLTHPGTVVVATGSGDRHEVFIGNDLPGVWQGRAAGVLVSRYGLLPGRRAVVVAGSPEAAQLVQTLREGGVRIAAVVARGSEARGDFGDARIIAGSVERALGRRRVRGVCIRTVSGSDRIRCDALVVSSALTARDTLLRMSTGLRSVTAVGDVIEPDPALPIPVAGVVCLCEDVLVGDLTRAVEEGFDTSELLKRYTTASMGPCQGVQCGRYVACMASPATPAMSSTTSTRVRTTARPPARTVALERLVGPDFGVIHRRTALHKIHAEAGAELGPSGAWVRPFHYGDPRGEYWAVRERVSLMDVSTLGSFLIAGRDADRLVDHVFPGRVNDLELGHARYVLMLDDTGYVADDGMVVALMSGGYSLTTTSGGAARTGPWLQLLADRQGMNVHVVDLSEATGAILVAGPRSRALLQDLTNDDVGPEAFPYMTCRDLSVGSVQCEALRVGFVGELSFELHHPRDRSVELWTALTAAGSSFDLMPHGLDALDVLRLEKGHLYIGQDTLPDDTPRKLGLERMVDMSKDFVGRAGLVRLDALPMERSLAGLDFEGAVAPHELAGQPIWLDSSIVGRVTSCEYSPSLDRVIGLGWLDAAAGTRSGRLRAGSARVQRARTPFLDAEGTRVRA